MPVAALDDRNSSKTPIRGATRRICREAGVNNALTYVLEWAVAAVPRCTARRLNEFPSNHDDPIYARSAWEKRPVIRLSA